MVVRQTGSLSTSSSRQSESPNTMKELLLLMLLRTCWMSSSPGWLMVSPGWSQFLEYDPVRISCEHLGSGGWKVWRYKADRSALSRCGDGWGQPTSSTCNIILKTTDSGLYWCQSKDRDSSGVVNITVVTRKTPVLQSPVLPVMEGDNVTLSCRKDSSTSPSDFLKNGTLIRTESTGHMSLRNVSKSDQGPYSCRITGFGVSRTSWLLIRDDSEAASLTVKPDVSQLAEYSRLSLSCSLDGWKVKRFSVPGRNPDCGKGWGASTSSGCFLERVKPHDSATYWCEGAANRRSNSVSIMVSDKPVILQSPVLPVKEGDNVTLSCRTKTSILPADFYKDDSLISSEPAGHMTLHQVSRSDEGLYKCLIRDHGESPSSWLLVRAQQTSRSPSALETAPPLVVIRHIVVFSPYVISTILMVSLLRSRPAGRKSPVAMEMSQAAAAAEEEAVEVLDQDDGMADVTTEYHF